ncbi:MAG: tripartite tricarboxylate transporter TctB family protein [Armatimonadota bacterium]|nr:tripartite tricarboxylate transporter TctB family protein [Armatimonadota bacterium]
MRLGEAAAGVVLAAAGVYAAAAGSAFPRLAGGYPGPGLFPQILGLLLVACGIAVVWGARGPTAEAGRGYERRGLLHAAEAVVAVVVYIAVVNRLGFVPTVGILLTLLMARLGVSLARAVPVAFGLAVGLYLLFGRILRVPLPPGLLG